ncbi:TBP-associated factor 5 [Actinidia rufa]|uniref:TBP-associated factor 5 n=1 Tax=Actinidia rufa TaxID=165716 RepID=A0A7J0DU61_9ERIC|nr:TBP-associated factor 5 [Actinidia rufa]
MQHELLRVLYPVFIHCFMDLVAKGHIQEARAFFNSFREDHEMMHLRDLQKLEGVLSPSHLEEMEFAHSLRQSKVNIKICQCDKRFFWSGVEMSISVQNLNGWMFAVQRRKEVWGLEASKSGSGIGLQYNV